MLGGAHRPGRAARKRTAACTTRGVTTSPLAHRLRPALLAAAGRMAWREPVLAQEFHYVPIQGNPAGRSTVPAAATRRLGSGGRLGGTLRRLPSGRVFPSGARPDLGQRETPAMPGVLVPSPARGRGRSESGPRRFSSSVGPICSPNSSRARSWLAATATHGRPGQKLAVGRWPRRAVLRRLQRRHRGHHAADGALATPIRRPLDIANIVAPAHIAG